MTKKLKTYSKECRLLKYMKFHKTQHASSSCRNITRSQWTARIRNYKIEKVICHLKAHFTALKMVTSNISITTDRYMETEKMKQMKNLSLVDKW